MTGIKKVGIKKKGHGCHFRRERMTYMMAGIKKVGILKKKVMGVVFVGRG